MKIQCDVCEKQEASVFCSADEAALCGHCDRRVHHANKLAGKHHRFSLLYPSFKDSPRCDICQERRALLFCQEDRAILCRECDISIHRANELTQKHNRFLLSGVKLSTAEDSFGYQTATNSSNGSNYYAGTSESETETNINSISKALHSSTSTHRKVEEMYGSASAVSTSSISEYLMETLPGWHVEDFLDPSSHGFCKDYDYLSPFMENDLEGFMGPLISPHDKVPQGLPRPENVNNFNKSTRKWSKHGSVVPDNTPSTKKSKNSW